MKKIVIAVDSFKGSLSAQEVAENIELGIRKVQPHCQVVRLPLSDGGEGLIESIEPLIASHQAHQAHQAGQSQVGLVIQVMVHDPIGRLIKARYIIHNGVAVIEMAQAVGLTLLSDNERNPMITNTLGLGEMVMDAIEQGCREFVVGIGGSATNDAAMGMLVALGFRFLDGDGKVITKIGGEMLAKISAIDSSGVSDSVLHAKFTVACDVDNPFYGPQGAAHIYAPQKGATAQMINQLDAGLRNFAQIIGQTTGTNLQNIPGSGAAGGVGGAMVALLGASLSPGIDIVLRIIDFEKAIENADLVITGEGKIDSQTARGKAPMGVLRACKKHNIKVIAIAGAVSDRREVEKMGFWKVYAASPTEMPLSEAMKPEVAAKNVRHTASQAIVTFGDGR